MKRIVVKVKLPSKTEFISILSAIDMHFSEIFWQHDRIFVPKNFERAKNLPRLSLRTIVKNPEKPASYAIVLRRHIENKNVDVVNFTTVKDYTEAAHILHQLGFELKYEVSRHRQELTMSENVKIYLDKIDNLPGYYAKFESNLEDTDNPEDVQIDLVKTFEVLKVPRSNIVDYSFGELLER